MKALPLSIAAVLNVLFTTIAFGIASSPTSLETLLADTPLKKVEAIYAYNAPRDRAYDTWGPHAERYAERPYPERPYAERPYEERPYGRRPHPSIDRNYDSVIGAYNSARGSLYHTYEIPCLNAPGISCNPNALCH